MSLRDKQKIEVPNEAINYLPGNHAAFQHSNKSLGGNSLLSQSTGRLKYTGDLKSEKSHDFFKSTRVQSCSYVN